MPSAGAQGQAGPELTGHVRAKLSRQLLELIVCEWVEVLGKTNGGRGVGRASPHPRGDRDLLGDLDRDRWPVPPPHPETLQRPGDYVRSLDARGTDLVRAGAVAGGACD